MRVVAQRYWELKEEVRASLWFMVMTVLQKGILFLATPIYTRLLTTSEYGYYSLYVTWSGIFSIVATLNLSNGAFYKGMLKYECDRNGYISAMQGLGTVTTVICFGVAFLCRDLVTEISGLSFTVFGLMFLSFLFGQAFSYWTGFSKYEYRYRALCVWTLTSTVFTPALSIVLIRQLQERKFAVVLGTCLVQIGIGAFFYVRNWVKSHQVFNLKYWKFALKINVPLVPHYLSSLILGQADRVMINRYCGQDKVGIYSLAYSISLMLTIVVNAINSSFIPWTYKQIKLKEYRKIGRVSNYILAAVAVFCVLGTLIAPELIELLGTEEYLEARWIVPPVMLSVFFTMLYSMFGNIEFYYEKSSYVMVASIVAALVNIILNEIFIPARGYLAAGYTTMISYAVYTVLHYCGMKRICQKMKIESVYFMKQIVWMVIGICLLCGAGMLVYEYTVLRYTLIAMAILALAWNRKKILLMLNVIRME